MILLFFIYSQTVIDSLKNLIKDNAEFSSIIEFNKSCRTMELFDTANLYLSRYEEKFGFEEQAQLSYLIGENLFFKGNLLSAREQYLKTVAKYSNARYANDALERLHLFESARKDTNLLKRLAGSIYLYEIKELKSAQDSLKNLLKTEIGDYALYYLAVVYDSLKEYSEALAALEQLNKDFPASHIHQARLLKAEIYLKAGQEKEAIRILEELVVKHPDLPIGIRAREVLRGLKIY